MTEPDIADPDDGNGGPTSTTRVDHSARRWVRRPDHRGVHVRDDTHVARRTDGSPLAWAVLDSDICGLDRDNDGVGCE